MWSESTYSGIQDTIECPCIICYVVLSNDKLVILTLCVESYLYWVYSPGDISNYIHNIGCRASGGASVLIWSDISHSEINIQTNIQEVAIKATLHKTINIYSIYIPPNDNIYESELKKLVDQLSKPFILLGDLNSYNTLRSCKDTNKKGKTLEKIINENDLCLLNKDKQTYVNPTSGNHSVIDLTICDPHSLYGLYLESIWWHLWQWSFPNCSPKHKTQQ